MGIERLFMRKLFFFRLLDGYFNCVNWENENFVR